MQIRAGLTGSCGKIPVKSYEDYTRLVDSEALDAVIISLPNSLKGENIFSAYEKGLDIFVLDTLWVLN